MSISFALGSHRVRFAGRTDVGLVRQRNEDEMLVPTDVPLAVVADGMGGHARGDLASKLAVTIIDRYYRETAETAPATWPVRLPEEHIEVTRMATAIKLANAEIFASAQAESERRGMGCTVDAVYFAPTRMYVGHVGDSRVYRLRDDRLLQLTRDHSLLNDWLRMKEMEQGDAASFPYKNVVVRALGLAEHVAVDVLVREYVFGDRFLLCSDGLSGMLPDDRVCEILRAEDNLDAACAALVREANQAGGADNITAVLARVEEP
jgi:protein phosphatase